MWLLVLHADADADAGAGADANAEADADADTAVVRLQDAGWRSVALMASPAPLVHACICHLGSRAWQANHRQQQLAEGAAWAVFRTLNLPAGPLRSYGNLVDRQQALHRAYRLCCRAANITGRRQQQSCLALIQSPITGHGKPSAAVIDAALRLWLVDLRRHLTMIDCTEFTFMRSMLRSAV